MEDILGYIDSFESFALVDGPGVRSVLFLQGCPFRCLYCHNPETWEFIKKNPLTPKQVLDKLLRYKPYWKDHGGITISGGEPLSQIDFILALAKLAKKEGITTVIDTAGGPFSREEPFFSKFNELLKYVDLFLLDIKSIDSSIHKTITGKDNKNIIDLFRYLDEKGFPIWIRHVLVPSYTDDDEMLRRTSEFIASLNNVERVEVLPYHAMAIPKYEKLGIPYRLKDIFSPSKERVKNAEEILNVNKYTKYQNK